MIIDKCKEHSNANYLKKRKQHFQNFALATRTGVFGPFFGRIENKMQVNNYEIVINSYQP